MELMIIQVHHCPQNPSGQSFKFLFLVVGRPLTQTVPVTFRANVPKSMLSVLHGSDKEFHQLLHLSRSRRDRFVILGAFENSFDILFCLFKIGEVKSVIIFFRP